MGPDLLKTIYSKIYTIGFNDLCCAFYFDKNIQVSTLNVPTSNTLTVILKSYRDLKPSKY